MNVTAGLTRKKRQSGGGSGRGKEKLNGFPPTSGPVQTLRMTGHPLAHLNGFYRRAGDHNRFPRYVNSRGAAAEAHLYYHTPARSGWELDTAPAARWLLNDGFDPVYPLLPCSTAFANE